MINKITFIILGLLTLTIYAAASGAPNWGYIAPTGPTQWSTIQTSYLTCRDGTRQSPINICHEGTTFHHGLSFKISNEHVLLKGALENKATNVEYEIETAEKHRPNFIVSYNGAKGFNNGRYILQQFHFHWGSVDSQGSEHLIGGRATAGEVHFVARNAKYNSATAGNKADGYMVLGVGLRVCHYYSNFHSLFGSHNQYLKKIKAYPDKQDGIHLSLSSLYFCHGQCASEKGYYIYQGSFTTPACNQAVTWWLDMSPLCITRAQLNLLRAQKVKSSGPTLVNNFRPDQSLNQRVILTNHIYFGDSIQGVANSTLSLN